MGSRKKYLFKNNSNSKRQAVYVGKLHEWKHRVYNVYVRLQDIELRIASSATAYRTPPQLTEHVDPPPFSPAELDS
uniref:Uncharacterized protein n=1 Tax=Steinernema glaseri TaxID=37863 RepID=A0A1I7Z3H4_9BILA